MVEYRLRQDHQSGPSPAVFFSRISPSAYSSTHESSASAWGLSNSVASLFRSTTAMSSRTITSKDALRSAWLTPLADWMARKNSAKDPHWTHPACCPWKGQWLSAPTIRFNSLQGPRLGLQSFAGCSAGRTYSSKVSEIALNCSRQSGRWVGRDTHLSRLRVSATLELCP